FRSLEAPLGEPLGLALLRGERADDVLIQPGGEGVGLQVGDEAVGVALLLPVGAFWHRAGHARRGLAGRGRREVRPAGGASAGAGGRGRGGGTGGPVSLFRIRGSI